MAEHRVLGLEPSIRQALVAGGAGEDAGGWEISGKGSSGLEEKGRRGRSGWGGWEARRSAARGAKTAEAQQWSPNYRFLCARVLEGWRVLPSPSVHLKGLGLEAKKQS